ncbi:MAG TPA: hypothetical protein ENO20_01470 [Bacteroides sp.]|nr:hypothetical protein [Bacteroides sp.]
MNITARTLFSFLFTLFLVSSCQKNEPPVCSITEPADGAVFNKGELISLKVDADDPDGIITEARLFINGTGIKGLEYPFQHEIQTDEFDPGTYALKVTVWDNEALEASDEIEISVVAAMAQVITAPASAVSFDTAVVGGAVLNDGGSTITGAGIYWDTVSSPETEGTKITMASDTGQFTGTITGLPRGKMIYYRAFAENGAGVSYGMVMNFQTTTIPAVLTGPVDSVTVGSVLLRGNINSDGGETVVEKGFYWGEQPDPETTGTRDTVVSGESTFRKKLTGLSPVTTYYVKAFAVNAAGESLGEEVSFATKGMMTVVTGPVVTRKFKSLEVSGEVTTEEGTELYEKGFYWSEDPGPATTGVRFPAGNQSGPFTVSMTDLSPGNTYYYCVYAVNAAGEKTGEELSVYLPGAETGTFTDPIDNLEYGTVTLGEQIWMTENLRAGLYNDSTIIPFYSDSASWSENEGPGYCWGGFDTLNMSWGAFYTWETVQTGKLCPSGWHVSSDADWKQLEIFLGMDETEADQLNLRGTVEGGMMKTTDLWDSPNTGATNETGLSVIPSGTAEHYASFSDLNREAYIWTSDAYSTNEAIFRSFRYSHAQIRRSYTYKAAGYSVRCVRDE